MRILFIGNIHTYYNDMPHTFADICCEHHVETEVTMLAHGGKVERIPKLNCMPRTEDTHRILAHYQQRLLLRHKCVKCICCRIYPDNAAFYLYAFFVSLTNLPRYTFP